MQHPKRRRAEESWLSCSSGWVDGGASIYPLGLVSQLQDSCRFGVRRNRHLLLVFSRGLLQHQFWLEGKVSIRLKGEMINSKRHWCGIGGRH